MTGREGWNPPFPTDSDPMSFPCRHIVAGPTWIRLYTTYRAWVEDGSLHSCGVCPNESDITSAPPIEWRVLQAPLKSAENVPVQGEELRPKRRQGKSPTGGVFPTHELFTQPTPAVMFTFLRVPNLEPVMTAHTRERLNGS